MTQSFGTIILILGGWWYVEIAEVVKFEQLFKPLEFICAYEDDFSKQRMEWNI